MNHFGVLWCVCLCVCMYVYVIDNVHLFHTYLICVSVGSVILSLLKGNFSELEINSPFAEYLMCARH